MIKIAKSYFDLNLLDLSKSYIDKIISLDSKYFEAILLSGEIFLCRGEINNAENESDQVIALDPQFPFGYLLKAKCLKKKGLIKEAIENFEKCLQISPLIEEASY